MKQRVRSRTMSIYLLKEGIQDSDALKQDRKINQVTDGSIPNGATLFLYDPVATPPWWKSYLNIKNEISQSLKGAILFLSSCNRRFAVVFGNAASNLDPISYESDFGLLATLNATDPERLRTTDTIEPETARRNRIQAPSENELVYFNRSTNDKVFKKLAGAVKTEFKDLFSNITGTESVRVTTRKQALELDSLCSRLLTLFQSQDYKTTFPGLRNICRIFDADLINQLNSRLLNAIRAKDNGVLLSVPDNLNYDQISGFWFGKSKKKYTMLLMSSFWNYMGDSLNTLTWKQLQRCTIQLLNENDFPINTYSMSQSVIWETMLNATSYHVVDGIWYSVETDFMERLNNDIRACFHQTNLPANYETREDAYNRFVEKHNPRYICLDRTNFAGSGNVEPCDLYTVENGKPVFIHVKIGVQSARLSHLFQQGRNSFEYLGADCAGRKQKLSEILRSKIPDQTQADEFCAALDSKERKIIYAIITKKDPGQGVNALPLFSKITLAQILDSFRLTNSEIEVQLVKDAHEEQTEKTELTTIVNSETTPNAPIALSTSIEQLEQERR